jgi:hypothetical protein
VREFRIRNSAVLPVQEKSASGDLDHQAALAQPEIKGKIGEGLLRINGSVEEVNG